ncbi:MAG: hypothetical protein PHF56_16265 [Desulfuromonadaceae bacterium]|nr:hypothetical protein [Desulfuromonadaceae bacterium]
MRKICSGISLFALCIFLQACGGGGGESVVPRAQKTAIVEFATFTTNTNANALTEGVTMSARLPEGVTVATDQGSSITISGALVGVHNFLISFPTYASATNEVTFYATNVSNTAANVVFARLICDVKPGYTLSAAQFSSITPTVFEPIGPGGSDLKQVSPPVLPNISVTFGY